MINEPLISKPILTEKIWGNSDLDNIFGYKGKQNLGEIWLLSPLKEKGTCLFGKTSNKNYGFFRDIFPKYKLLLKLISSSDWLSIQLHPDDKMAKEIENHENGKTEAWYFLKDGGNVKVTNNNQKIINALDNNDWNNVFEDYSMNKGDCLFIPAGTVHTLGPGSFMFEVQQASDVTYRLYDWGRDREIHIEKAKKVLKNVFSSYFLSRNINEFSSKYFNFKTIKNKKQKGFGVYINTKNYETIVLPENVEYFFDGEYIKFEQNQNGWRNIND